MSLENWPEGSVRWLSLLAALGIGLLIHVFGRRLLRSVIDRVHQRLAPDAGLRSFLGLPLDGPLAGLVGAAVVMTSIRGLGFDPNISKVLLDLCTFAVGFFIIRLGLLGAEAVGHSMIEWSRRTDNGLHGQLALFTTKSLKVLVVIVGVLMILQNVGVNVVSLIAGLGLGGLALALAAQDTAANLFGSVTILADRPFKIGDWVSVAGTDGLVSEIGFRSTRIQTAAGSLVTLPNSTIAKEKIENFGLRKTRLSSHVVGVEYGASPVALSQLVAQIRSYLFNHVDVLKDDILVFFEGFGDSSLNIRVRFFIRAEKPIDFFETQEEILLEIMQIVGNNKLGFAFPTRTLHIGTWPEKTERPRDSSLSPNI